jgi:serine/threonine protein kinase
MPFVTPTLSADTVAKIAGSRHVTYLGHGSFGETWLVVRADAAEAWKFLCRPGYDGARLTREIEGLSRAHSDNVVRLLGVETSNIGAVDVPILRFEYIQGGDLEGWLSNAGNQATHQNLINLARGLIDGVRCLHEVKVIHRDIKPANIGLRSGVPDHPVLLDLGLAKLMDVDSITRYPTLVGNTMYASPEQWQGQRARKASDLWSIGCVLYEAAARRHPFFTVGDAIEPAMIMKRFATYRPLDDSVPASYQTIVSKFLSIESYRRGSTSAALRILDADHYC